MSPVDLSALDDFIADLRRIADQIEDDTDQVTRTAGNLAAAEMQRLAAVDTGTMRNSVGVDVHDTNLVEVGPTVDYAPHVEYGTSRTRAQPFVNPAGDYIEPIWQAGIEAAVMKGMNS